jgi:RNA polymerase sigma-70 factor (ECF subfamily)
MSRATQRTSAPVRTDPDEDRALLERIALGDRIAMQKFYFAFHRRLSRFLLRTLRRPEQAEEIINDAMFVVWRQAANFRGESRVSTWLMGIAYRLALKRLRQEHGRRSISLSVTDGSADHDPGHDSGAGQREQREWIDNAMTALPPAQRLAIELAYFMGYSCEEISIITDCPVNTVKTRLFHARERLRALLPHLSGGQPTEISRGPA